MICEQYFQHRDCRAVDPRTLGHTAVLTDPPYDPHVHSQMTSCAQDGDVKGVRHRDAGFVALDGSLREYVVDCVMAAPGWSAVYTDLESVGTWRDALGRRAPKGPGRYVRAVIADWKPGDLERGVDGTEYAGVLPWLRWSSPQQSGDRPPQGAEALVLAHGLGRMHWRGPGNLTHLNHKAERGDAKHPTAKPLDQCLDLVSWFTDPGDVVYDPTGGAGSLGVACALLGRNYFGCNWGDGPDADAARHWAEVAQQRIADARAGRLSKRDEERLNRWLVSVARRSQIETGLIWSGSIPEEFKALRKGMLP